MLASFRRYANTWVARALFILLAAAFGLWGVADMLRNLGTDTSVAQVGGQKIEAQAFQEAYRQQLAQTTRMLGGRTEPTPEMRQAIAMQTLDRMVIQTAIQEEVRNLGLAVPDSAVRQTVFDIPAFRGPNGQFDRATFQRVLANNNLTEDRFLSMVRDDLGNRQLLEAVRAGVIAPEVLARQVYAFQNEKRTADMVELPFADAPAPPAPTEAELHRWYDNHPDSYTSPEYRKIKAAILSPDILAKSIDVPDSELRAAYDQNKSRYVTPEKRSVQVVLSPDEKQAQALAEAWKQHPDWAAEQQAAKDAKASSVELDDAAKGEIPTTELANAVFAAQPDTITGPVKTPLGWYVLRVTKVTPGKEQSFDQVKQQLHDQIARQKAADQVYDRANKVEDALAGGASLDELPGDLGLAGVTGTLDAQGETPEGEQAPIPGSAQLRQALIEAAFAMKPGDPPHLTQAPDNSYYAVTVQNVIPSARKPFDTVKDQVAEDWRKDRIRHEQNAAAAKLLTAVKNGQSFADATTIAGLRVTHTPPIARGAAPPEGVPAQLVGPLFSIKKGEPTMAETPDGFIVAVLTDIQDPDPQKDPAGFGQTRDALTQVLGNDVETVFANALRDRAKPRFNKKTLDQIAQP